MIQVTSGQDILPSSLCAKSMTFVQVMGGDLSSVGSNPGRKHILATFTKSLACISQIFQFSSRITAWLMRLVDVHG